MLKIKLLLFAIVPQSIEYKIIGGGGGGGAMAKKKKKKK
jgi:hypothetical protein